MRLVAVFALLAWLPCAEAADSPLAIEDLALAQLEDGPPWPADQRLLPGETAFFSCRVSGYQKNADSKVSLSYEVHAVDAKGVPLIAPETGKMLDTVTPEDKKWRPKIHHSIALPPLVDTGDYRIIVHVKDEFGKAEVEKTLVFHIKGHDVEPSETLVVRNFRFLRAEEDKEALKVAAYRPGDAIWARFDMTGYKLGAKNHYDVDYGLQVLRPNGEVAYDVPKAAAESNESFYPQRYTPGVLNFTLPADLPLGKYIIVLTVRDNFGRQSCETRQTFSVE
jgi:hypothetical protein